MDSDAGATGISTKDAVSIVGLLCGRLVDGERAGCGECARYCSSVNNCLQENIQDRYLPHSMLQTEHQAQYEVLLHFQPDPHYPFQ